MSFMKLSEVRIKTMASQQMYSTVIVYWTELLSTVMRLQIGQLCKCNWGPISYHVVPLIRAGINNRMPNKM